MSIEDYTKKMARHSIGINELNKIKVMQHITDNISFYTFSYTQNNLFRYNLIGGRGETQYSINLYPSKTNEEKNIAILIDFFHKITP